MRFVTTLTLQGVESCVDTVEAMVDRIKALYIPLPRETCEGRPVEMPSSIERLLEPIMGLYSTYREVEWRCYLDSEHVRKRILASHGLASLVVKGAVYGRIDMEEWDRYFASVTTDWLPRGDALIPWYIAEREDVIYCGTTVPTPLDIAANVWGKATRRDREYLARLIVEYIHDYVLFAADIDTAYDTFVRDRYSDIRYFLSKYGLPH